MGFGFSLQLLAECDCKTMRHGSASAVLTPVLETETKGPRRAVCAAPVPNSVSLSLPRRGSPALALRRGLHPGGRLTCCHTASAEVPGVRQEKLGKWKATQLGNLLRARLEEENVQQGSRACQQYINLRGAAHGAPGGQEAGPQGSWHHPCGWGACGNGIFRFYAVPKETWKHDIST